VRVLYEILFRRCAAFPQIEIDHPLIGDSVRVNLMLVLVNEDFELLFLLVFHAPHLRGRPSPTVTILVLVLFPDCDKLATHGRWMANDKIVI